MFPLVIFQSITMFEFFVDHSDDIVVLNIHAMSSIDFCGVRSISVPF